MERISLGSRRVPGFGLSGASYEAAIAANVQQMDMSKAPIPDLTDAQLAAPMSNVGSFLTVCGTPDGTEVTVHVAIKLGRAVGVTVTTNPPNKTVAACVDKLVRKLAWPSSPKLDSFTTRY
jgi:hypothetical protein